MDDFTKARLEKNADELMNYYICHPFLCLNDDCDGQPWYETCLLTDTVTCPDCGSDKTAPELPLYQEDDIQCGECESVNLGISETLGLYCRDCQSQLDIKSIEEAG